MFSGQLVNAITTKEFLYTVIPRYIAAHLLQSCCFGGYFLTFFLQCSVFCVLIGCRTLPINLLRDVPPVKKAFGMPNLQKSFYKTGHTFL